MRAKIEKPRARFNVEAAVGMGDLAPDFQLPDVRGRSISLADFLLRGPVIAAFYRSGWRPYCTLQLKVYQSIMARITALGGHLVAISPQLSDGSLSASEENELTFHVLSDVGNHVARRFGLVYALPEELRHALRSNNKGLPGINGDERWELPVPATYVIAPDRRVALPYVEVVYRKRLETDTILASLASLRSD